MSTPSPSADAGRRRFRKLRIAWSVACGIACVLLLVLWVRSYWRIDAATSVNGSDYIHFELLNGEFHLARLVTVGNPTPWRSLNRPISNTDVKLSHKFHIGIHHAMGIGWELFGNGWKMSVPLVLPAIASGALLVILWVPWKWRFSLRTLLVATTLVAVVLGAIVYAVK
jgi:hypothetical protein